MRMAINRSNNNSAAHALMDYVGIGNSVAYLLKLSIDPDHILATGGSAAAPLWAAMMVQVHTLTNSAANRSIMPGNAADYGLCAETVCGVSGILPTDACRADVNDYPLVTDYFTVDSRPTARCNMHRAVKLCRNSGMAASRYCENVETKVVINIPEGHPLRYASDMDVVQSYFYGASTSE